MTAIGVIALVVAGIVGNVVWFMSYRLAGEWTRVAAPDGRVFKVVAHREGVPAYTKTEAP